MRDELELQEIKAFVAVARAGGFSMGGQAVGLTRSAVGKAVTRLEGRLGVRLLHRTTRSVRLTTAGEAFNERCRQILADLEEAEAEIRQSHPEPKGVLRLTLPDAFGRQCVLPVLSRYLMAWPELVAEVSFTDRIVDLVEEGYDLAVRCGGPLLDTRLIAWVIARFPTILCASPEYLAAHGAPRCVEDLDAHSRLAYGSRVRSRAWTLTPPGGKPVRIAQLSRVSLDNADALRQAALAGLGIAYLPSFLIEEEVARGRLSVLLPDHETEHVVAHALFPSRRHLASKIRLLVDRLAAELGNSSKLSSSLLAASPLTT